MGIWYAMALTKSHRTSTIIKYTLASLFSSSVASTHESSKLFFIVEGESTYRVVVESGQKTSYQQE